MSRPERGARFLFELTGEDEREARYALTIFTPDAEHRADVKIAAEGGAVTLEPGEDGELELAVEARALAKTLYSHRRGDERGRWKRRLMRWRES
jgi:hypothetical protein